MNAKELLRATERAVRTSVHCFSSSCIQIGGDAMAELHDKLIGSDTTEKTLKAIRTKFPFYNVVQERLDVLVSEKEKLER